MMHFHSNYLLSNPSVSVKVRSMLSETSDVHSYINFLVK